MNLICTCFIVAGSHMQCHHVWLAIDVNFDYRDCVWCSYCLLPTDTYFILNYACNFMPLIATMFNSLFSLPLVTAAYTVYDKTFEGKMFAVPVINIYYVGKTYVVCL